MSNPSVILAGGSGFLGTALIPALRAAGYDIVVLTRGPARNDDGIRFLHWDGKTLGPWQTSLDGAAAVINLTGKSVNCRYTGANRREINASRIDSVRVLGEAVARCSQPPKVWIQCASAAIFGNRGDEILDENSPPGTGFSPETCIRWEAAFSEVPLPSPRRVLLRIGFVLGNGGGALETLATLTRFLLGGTVGSGRQWISWIHVQDLNRLILRAIEKDNLSGIFLAVNSQPVRNARFMLELRRALHRPWSPPVPEWAVRVGSWMMRTEAELALTGRRCMPRRLSAAGFEFTFPELRRALDDLLGK
jgi:hypothetical protein